MKYITFICAVAIIAPTFTWANEERVEDSANNLRFGFVGLPLEDILEDFAKKAGVSLIFDSRVVQGVRIPPLDTTKPPERALRDGLYTVQLELHSIDKETYAITASKISVFTTISQNSSPIVQTPILNDTIVVTALMSSVAATDSDARRLFVLDKERLATLSVVNPADAVFDLPQSFASITASNTAFLGATAGLNLADLRGFGGARTLVLVNGRRRTATAGGNGNISGFDLNSLSEPFLERIEVAPRFGGAQFGPEAVAGAINFVTRRVTNGIHSGVRYGVSQQGDAQEFSIYALGGKTVSDGAGEFTIGLNHTRQSGLLGRDRSITSSPYGFSIDGITQSFASDGAMFLPEFGGSPLTSAGQLLGFLDSTGQFQFLESSDDLLLDGNGDVTPFIGSRDQLFNWLVDSNTIIPLNRTLGFAELSYEVNSNITLFAETNVGYSEIRTSISPLPGGIFQGVDPEIGNAAAIPIDSGIVPETIRQLVINANGTDAQTLVIARRYPELGPRRRNTDRLNLESVMGTNVTFGKDISFHAYYRYGRNTAITDQLGRIDRDRLLVSLDTVQCVVTDECTPIDLFRDGGLSTDAAVFISADAASRKLALNEHELSVDLKVLLDEIVKEGAILNAGISFRRTRISDRNLTPDMAPTIGSFVDIDFNGAANIAEGYASVEFPLFADLPYWGDLDFVGDIRLTASSESSLAENVEASLTWRPKEGITLFGGYGRGERQPNVTELFVVGRSIEGFFEDPCVSPSGTAQLNCMSGLPLGVGSDFTQTSVLATQTFFGNSDLENETTENYHVGISLQPLRWINTDIGQLDLTATWLSYHLKNQISGQEGALSSCFNSINFSSPACGVNPLTGSPLLRRDPTTQQIVAVDTLLLNGGDFEWQGLDLEARYVFEVSNWRMVDRVWLRGLHTYTQQVLTTDILGTMTDQMGLVDYPKHQSLLTAGVDTGSLSFSALARRRGRAQSARSDLSVANIPIVTTYDLTARYALQGNLAAFLTVENIANQEAPLVAFSAGRNTFSQHYDIIGRRFSLGVKASF